MAISRCHEPVPVSVGPCLLGLQPIKVLSSLSGSTSADLQKSIRTLEQMAVDIIEWRIDYIESLNFQSVLSTAIELRMQTSKPLLGTLRTKQEGGNADIDDEAYHALVGDIAGSKLMDAIDVEFSRGRSNELIDIAHDNNTPVILSYHNFDETPSKKELLELFSAMNETKADVIKMAVMPRTPDDVLRLMQCTLQMREHSDKPLITMAMGALGGVTRVAGSLFGSCATFAAAQNASAPGQLPVDTVRSMLDALSIDD